MSRPDEPRPNSRWEYRFVDGRVDSFGVAGLINRATPEGRTVLVTLGGCPAGGIRLSTWKRWVAEKRLVEIKEAP